MAKVTLSHFWERFDVLASLPNVGRYNLPGHQVMEDAIDEHGLERILALVEYVLADQKRSKPSLNNPSGLIVSTIRGNIPFPERVIDSVDKKRSKKREKPNWMIQALESITQFKYYVVHDSKGVRQKDLTYSDINSLWETGPSNNESELIDQFWVVYGCMKLLRNPSISGEYPTPELSMCRSFTMFNSLTAVFRKRVTISKEDLEHIQSYIERHRKGMERFESQQPGLIKISGTVNEGENSV